MEVKLRQSNSIAARLSLIVIVLIICCSKMLSSCGKTGVMPRFSSLHINLKHTVDGDSVYLDPYQYLNAAGNVYSITDLKYYISNIRLIGADGNLYYDEIIHYVDLSKTQSMSFVLDSIVPGLYSKISFDLGIDSTRNSTGSLTNTVDNLNMAWPITMGGGYHFLKFEGKFISNGSNYGFAFHTGKSKSIIHYEFDLNKKLNYWNEHITLNHNLSEWFKNPTTYDFDFFEPYTMNDDSVMQVVQINGQDVFSL